MKVVIIGSNHAGTAAAKILLKDAKNEVVIYDRNDNISFLGCGMALWIGKQIDEPDGLFYSCPEELQKLGAKVNIRTEVTSVDFVAKTLHFRTADGKTGSDGYDKLILATGSRPRTIDAPGRDLKNISNAKLFRDATAAIEILNDPAVKNVAVIGAGYIGVELAEACQRLGKQTTLFDLGARILCTHIDEKFSKPVQNRMAEHGIALKFGEKILRFEGDGNVKKLVTDKSETDVDFVFTCTGFEPATDLGKNHLKLGTAGAYLVNTRFQTSDPDVYAIGDCATCHDNAIENENYIALATNAVRSGIIAALNISGVDIESPGVQGSSALCIYDYRIVSTGLSLDAAKRHGIEVEYTDYTDRQFPEFMKVHNENVQLRVVYRKSDKVVLGAQLSGENDMSAGIHMYSLAIQEKLTIDRLALLDIFFMPHFNKPYNYYTLAGLGACLP